MKFVAYDGEIQILPDGKIHIQKGKRDMGRVIALKDVVSVTIIKPKFTAAGCIHIQVYGGKTHSVYANVTHYAMDMNAICFRKPQYDEAVMFKDALEQEITKYKN